MATTKQASATADKTSADAGKTVTVIALVAIEHDGERYEAGEQIADLTAKQAKALIDLAAAEAA
ncbi:hypothetical protein [Chitinimonas sp.]|uniref:DUF7210 family protein n=1 Tax=Chitinimonas sp. TaxID=1934313 RepID=UPI0035B2C068